MLSSVVISPSVNNVSVSSNTPLVNSSHKQRSWTDNLSWSSTIFMSCAGIGGLIGLFAGCIAARPLNGCFIGACSGAALSFFIDIFLMCCCKVNPNDC